MNHAPFLLRIHLRSGFFFSFVLEVGLEIDAGEDMSPTDSDIFQRPEADGEGNDEPEGAEQLARHIRLMISCLGTEQVELED